MLIEVVKPQDMSNTEKGNLLEKLAEELLRGQGYRVLSQVRVTATELDLGNYSSNLTADFSRENPP